MKVWGDMNEIEKEITKERRWVFTLFRIPLGKVKTWFRRWNGLLLLLVLPLLISCGGAGADAGGSEGVCAPIEGRYKTAHFGFYGGSSWGYIEVYPDGTFFAHNQGNSEDGPEISVEDAWGHWEMMDDCSIEAWYGDRRVYYKIITNEDRTVGSFVSVSESPDFPNPREYGQIYK